MGNIIKVNWTKLREMGKLTNELAVEIEDARTNFQTIVNSLNDCWEGTDATNFVGNCNNFLEDFKKDTLYFSALAQYFDKGSKTYNQVVDAHSQKINRMNNMMLDDKQTFNIVPKDMVSVGSGNLNSQNGISTMMFDDDQLVKVISKDEAGVK